MAFAEDLSTFLADFGVPVSARTKTSLGIFSMPGEVGLDGMSISTDYRLTALACEFGKLRYGDAITVAGVKYNVRENRPLDDGTFCEVLLMKP